MAGSEHKASTGEFLLLCLINIAIVLIPSALLYRKYGLAEAAAFFVIAATLLEIRSRLAGNKEK